MKPNIGALILIITLMKMVIFLKFTYYLARFASGCTKILRDERDQFFTKRANLLKSHESLATKIISQLTLPAVISLKILNIECLKTVGELIAKKNLLSAFLKINKIATAN